MSAYGALMQVNLAVRQVSTGEQVLFSAVSHDEGAINIERVDFLERGESYEIGIATRYTGCAKTDPGWTRAAQYIELDEVNDDVSITRTLTEDEENDYRACDVLHVPVDIPPGQYSASGIGGQAGNEITFSVSETGRLYERRTFVLCDGSADSACAPSLLTSTSSSCVDRTPLPGRSTVTLAGSDQDGETTLEAVLSVDSAAGVLRVTGRSETSVSVFADEPCCGLDFDLALPRVGDNADCL